MTAVDWGRACGGGSAAHLVRRRGLALKQGYDAASNEKIDDERRWLTWVAGADDPAVRAAFVAVNGRRSRRGLLAMPWIDGGNARAMALDGVTDRDVLRQAVHTAAVTLFRSGRVAAPDDLVPGWWADQLTRRLRLAHARGRSVPGLMDLRYVRLVGGVIANPLFGGVTPLLDRLRGPRAVGPIHGDLHLGNLIVTADGQGTWVDPRGRFGDGRAFDVAYDVAKLLHEPHYVAARAHAARSAVVVHQDEAVVLALRSPTPADKRVLRPLTRESLALATYVCQAFGADDPDLAARATLYVGLLFITVLPFDVLVDGEWETMLVSGLLWLSAGLAALRGGLGLRACRSLWAELTGDVEHHAAAAALAVAHAA